MNKSIFALSLFVVGMSLAACGGTSTPTKVPATSLATALPQAATAEATNEATKEASAAATKEATVKATTKATMAATMEATAESTMAATKEATAKSTTAPTKEPTAKSTTSVKVEKTAESVAVAMATAEVAATAAPMMATAESTAAAPNMVSTWKCPTGFSGQTLSVYNWADYIGETTVRDFEKLCGVKVNYEFFENNEQVISRLRQGNPGYDVIFANTYAIQIMIRDGLLEKIDLSKIPNFKNISPRWLNMSQDPKNEYSVPYLWGSIGVAYDKTKVKTPITSWNDVFNYDGPVAWQEDQRAMMGVALKMLDYSNSSTDPKEINEAKDFLIKNSKNVKVIAADDGQALLERGEVDIAIEYSGDIYQLGVTCKCDKYVYTIPKEGSVADMAAALIPKDALNAALGHAFIDYLNDPVVAAQIVNFVAYGTTNQAAIDSGIIPKDMLNNSAVFLDAATLKTMYFTEDVAAAEQSYNDAWDELKINIGK